MPLPAPPAHRAKRTVASRLRDARGTSGNAALRTRLALPERVMAKAGSGQKSGKRPRSCAAQPRPSPPGKRRRAPAVAGDAQPPSEGSAAGKSDPKPPTAARHRLCPGRGRASQPVVVPDRASQPVVVDGSRVLASGGASEPVALPEAVREASRRNKRKRHWKKMKTFPMARPRLRMSSRSENNSTSGSRPQLHNTTLARDLFKLNY